MKKPKTRRVKTNADHWRVHDPLQYARYLSALECMHQSVLTAAEQWLGVTVHIGGTGQLVVSSRGREAKAPLHADAFGSTAALRRQIVHLAAQLPRPAGNR